MGEYWEPTSDMFTSLIQKPKMTQKLLSKPPFRYIFDIFYETSKKTNFGQGLFTGNQLSGDYYNDKQKKLQFLQKLIKLIETMQGSQVKAKSQKIVAGLQPELTNLMLQSMFKLATSGQSSDPFVAKILGVAPVQQHPKKQQKQQKQQQPKKPQPKQEKKKIERPPSARNQKKIQQQPPSKKEVETHEQPPAQEPQVVKPNKKATGKQQYSQKVKQMMNEGEQEVQAQKQAEAQEKESKKDINMGRLRKKQNQDNKEKVVNTGADLSDKELDLVKTMVQSICQNVGPLGKSIEFINDDIESMNKELVYWRKQYNASKAKYQNQLKISEQALMPIYDKLAEIQDQIKDQKGKIQAAKSQIIKNDSTIKDLLMSVVTTK